MDELFDWDTGEKQAQRSGVVKQDAASHLREAAGANVGFRVMCQTGGHLTLHPIKVYDTF